MRTGEFCSLENLCRFSISEITSIFCLFVYKNPFDIENILGLFLTQCNCIKVCIKKIETDRKYYDSSSSTHISKIACILANIFFQPVGKV